MVLVADECRVEKEAGAKAIWYPSGHYPEIKIDRDRQAVSFYAALSVKTGQCHSRQTRWQNSRETVKFLKQLETKHQGKKALLIWDGAPSHRGEVREYLKLKPKHWRLKIIYFPAYSPDLNPQEHVWKSARQQILHNSEAEFSIRVKSFSHYLRRKRFQTNFLNKYLGV